MHFSTPKLKIIYLAREAYELSGKNLRGVTVTPHPMRVLTRTLVGVGKFCPPLRFFCQFLVRHRRHRHTFWHNLSLGQGLLNKKKIFPTICQNLQELGCVKLGWLVMKS